MTIPIPSARGLRFFRSILCAMTAASYLVASPVLAQESSSGEADALFRSGLEHSDLSIVKAGNMASAYSEQHSLAVWQDLRPYIITSVLCYIRVQQELRRTAIG